MNYTSLSRDELIKSARSAIQDLNFIFTRLVDNPSEKQSYHLLPAVSRPLDHIREVTMALDNQFMQQFNSNERSDPGTFHPNSGAPFPNFGAPPPNMFNPNYNPNMSNMHMPPPHMGNHNTFAPYMRVPESLLTVIKLLKDDPTAVVAVSHLAGQLFPVQDFRLNPSLRLLTVILRHQRRFDFSDEELKEILQAIEAYLEQWVSSLNDQDVQPFPQLELEDWKAIVKACDAEINIITGMRLPKKKLVLIIAKSKVFNCEKFDLGQLVLDVFLSDNPRPLKELKEIAKQVIATWPKESTPSHNPFDVKETPDVQNPFLFNNITKLRSVITVIDNIFNGEQNNDGGPKLTMIEHAIHVNKLLKTIKFWSISEPETNFNAPPFVVQCPADWSKVQIHVTKELHHQAMQHLEAISHPDCASRLSLTDWEHIEKAAENIDFMKKHKDMLRSILFHAIDKDFIGNNQVSNSHRLYAFHRLINNFVYFNGNDEENFMLIKSLVLKD